MKTVLSRTYTPDLTKGSFIVMDGCRKLLEIVTLELPNKGNRQNVSCIPENVYIVRKHTSPTKGACFQIMDVSGRENVLIHIGNFATGLKIDTQGCIRPGMFFADINADGFTDVGDSTTAMKLLLALLPQEFSLHII